MTTTLGLRLAAPLQAWGTRSRFTVRDTDNEPSKSGIIGLLCAALGRPRDADLEDLTALRFGVRIDAPGRLERDFHTVMGVPNTKGASPSTVVSERYYLADATFVAGLEGDPELLELLDAALWAPRWPLALGRRSCVPTPPLSLGLTNETLEDTLATLPWQVTSGRFRSEARRQLGKGTPHQLLTVTDANEASGDDTRNDVPISFQYRTFRPRNIRRSSVPLTLELMEAALP